MSDEVTIRLLCAPASFKATIAASIEVTGTCGHQLIMSPVTHRTWTDEDLTVEAYCFHCAALNPEIRGELLKGVGMLPGHTQEIHDAVGVAEADQVMAHAETILGKPVEITEEQYQFLKSKEK